MKLIKRSTSNSTVSLVWASSDHKESALSLSAKTKPRSVPNLIEKKDKPDQWKSIFFFLLLSSKVLPVSTGPLAPDTVRVLNCPNSGHYKTFAVSGFKQRCLCAISPRESSALETVSLDCHKNCFGSQNNLICFQFCWVFFFLVLFRFSNWKNTLSSILENRVRLEKRPLRIKNYTRESFSARF